MGIETDIIKARKWIAESKEKFGVLRGPATGTIQPEIATVATLSRNDG
jgi:hypothetical protein